MATNFRVKMSEIGRLNIRRLGIPKRSEMSQFRFPKVHLRRSGYTSCKNLSRFGPVALQESKKLEFLLFQINL